MEYPKFKVCCRCFTFNQAKYITDAMNGFTMQQTSFPFVCTIVDDASTDGEQDVIRKYVEDNFDLSEGSVAYHKETDYAYITYAQHKTNKNCYFAVLYLKENHYSQRKPKMGYLSEWRDMCEYEAVCEGDDYWIVPNKLEKQVDYLEENPDYGMCGSRVYHLTELTQKIRRAKGSYRNNDFNSVLIGGGIGTATCTVIYRLKLLKGYRDFVGSQKWLMGDFPLWLYLLRDSKIHIFDEAMGVYRILQESASHFKSYEKAKAFQDSVRSVQLYFAHAYDETAIPKIEENNFRNQFYLALSYARTKEAINYAKQVKLTLKDYLIIIKIILKNQGKICIERKWLRK